MRTEEKKKTKRILEALVPIFVVCYFLFWFYLYIFFKKIFFFIFRWLVKRFRAGRLAVNPIRRCFSFFFLFFFCSQKVFFHSSSVFRFVLFLFVVNPFLLLLFFVQQRFFPQVPVLLPLRSNKMCSISKKEPSMPQKKKRSDSGII